MTEINALAQILDSAAFNAEAVVQLSKQGHNLTLAEAYQVQSASVASRLARGEQQLGIKMGFTSRAKMQQMGVNDLIWGPLTNAMQIADGGRVSLQRFIHPRVEPEIAFRLAKPLSGVVTLDQAWAAIDAIAPALEIIDSRYKDFAFSLEDVVADNCSSSGFCLGAWHQKNIDISNLGMVMEFDGKAVQIGSSAAILGHPLRSLVEAARLAGEAGQTLPAGSIVLAGAATAAQALTPGCHVKLQTGGLGSVEFTTQAQGGE